MELRIGRNLIACLRKDINDIQKVAFDLRFAGSWIIDEKHFFVFHIIILHLRVPYSRLMGKEQSLCFALTHFCYFNPVVCCRLSILQ